MLKREPMAKKLEKLIFTKFDSMEFNNEVKTANVCIDNTICDVEAMKAIVVDYFTKKIKNIDDQLKEL